MNRLPNFVNMVSKCGSTTALRLVQIYGHKNLYGYYRDGGDWECGYIEKNGQLFSSSDIESIDGHKLIPITEEKWRESNGNYAPRTFERYGLDTISLGLPKEKNNYKYILIRR